MEISLNIERIEPAPTKDMFNVEFIGRLTKEQIEGLVRLSESGIVKVNMV
tara:strand:+ start:435 stop:584 length:150 start_codon:yes stop_codon:yes gene_type:complete